MKKLCLLIALVTSPVFAQEEEQEIEIESGYPGFRPAVLGPLIRPIFRPNVSSSYSSAILALL